MENKKYKFNNINLSNYYDFKTELNNLKILLYNKITETNYLLNCQIIELIEKTLNKIKDINELIRLKLKIEGNKKVYIKKIIFKYINFKENKKISYEHNIKNLIFCLLQSYIKLLFKKDIKNINKLNIILNFILEKNNYNLFFDLKDFNIEKSNIKILNIILNIVLNFKSYFFLYIDDLKEMI